MDRFSLIAWFVDLTGLPPSWGDQYEHVISALIVLIFILIISLLIWRKLRHTEDRLVPENRTTLANIAEVIVEALLRMLEDALGPTARRHLPLIAGLFLYLLISSLTGIVPGMSPPTESINTNLACAVVVFLYYNVIGIQTHGIRRYFKHMTGPVVWLAPLMLAIELISHIVRPVSLSIRLMGNILGDHVVLQIFEGIAPVIVPIVFMMLAIFVAFIQAFVFTLLSVIYIALAQAGDEVE